MATFTDEDKRRLDRLAKAQENVAQTDPTLSPWQEALYRYDASYAAKAAVAAKIMEGFAGSWAGSYNPSVGSSISPSGNAISEAREGPDEQGVSGGKRQRRSRIGQRGFPEIDFAPFSVHTNTFGPKGPSLIGHPISYEVVGPTLKNEFCDWIWKITEGGGDFGGDLLEMDMAYHGGASTSLTIAEAYNVQNFTIGGATEPNGGLYLVISEDGTCPGSLPGALVPMAPHDRFVDTVRFEVFRIVSARLNQITIHPNKPLNRFFNIPLAAVRYVRAITIIAPYVTRLAAIPTGKVGQTTSATKRGREQTFAMVLPERAASPDTYPPYNGPGAGLGAWLLGGFSDKTAPGSFGMQGEATAWGGKFRLPIPVPRAESFGTVEKAAALLPTVNIGLWKLSVADTTPFTTGPTPKIVHIFQTQRDDDLLEMKFGTISSCLGYFEVFQVAPGEVTLYRTPETLGIQSGQIFYGPGPYIMSVALTENVTVGMTIHDPIETMWQGPFNMASVSASRLTNLINPQWVHRLDKQISNTAAVAPPPGIGAGSSDRAIFDTRTGPGAPIVEAANPGNLQDLGFRVVLFPAKVDIFGNAVPDFNKPIAGRSIIIDPSVEEPQSISIDYTAGIVSLSHPPPNLLNLAIGEGDIIPNGIVGVGMNNPRGEVVLFAACVPYSMEVGQTGPAVRVQTQEDPTKPVVDPYSQAIVAKINQTETTYLPVAPFIGPATTAPNEVEIVLDRLWTGPLTGFVEITAGADISTSFGVWAYTVVVPRFFGGQSVSALGGLSCLASATDPTPGLGETRAVVLRHDVEFHTTSASTPPLVEKWYTDTSYGHARRGDSLVVRGASVESDALGRTVLVPGPDFSFLDRVWGTVLPSKLPTALGDPQNPTPARYYFAESGILTGLSYEVEPGHPLGPAPGGDFSIRFPDGPSLALVLDQLSPSWHGVVTRQTDPVDPGGIVTVSDGFKLTVKFAIEYILNNSEINLFIGFVQPLISPPTVEDVTLGPGGLGAANKVMGLWHEASVQPNLRIWTRGASDHLTDLPVDVDSVSALIHEPLTFVMEAPQYFPTATANSMELRTALYRGTRKLAQTLHTNTDFLPGGGPGLYFCAGARLTAGNPGVLVPIFKVSVIIRPDDPRGLTT